ncbi:MAG: alpha-2-macroglobulin family protein, partial [Alphaproteobacteria bacterium]
GALADALARDPDHAAAERALAAGWFAYLGAESVEASTAALVRLGDLLQTRLARPAQALDAFREALDQAPGDTALARRVLGLRREVGLRLRGVRTDPESMPPRACFDFSDPLSTARDIRFEDFVRIEPDLRVSAEASGESLCLGGFEHGRSYRVELREGLPGADGLSLGTADRQTVRMGHRTPSVAFTGGTFILPPVGDGLPVTTVNLERIAVKVLRVNDRRAVDPIVRNDFLTTLSRWSAEEIADQQGELVWSGTMDVDAAERNRQVRTTFPLGRVIDRAKPGLYVVTAEPADGVPGPYRWQVATQWVVVSDIGLTTLSGEDGLNVFARSDQTAQPLPGLDLKLVARNNELLGEAATDGDGRATFAPGLLRGRRGNAPAALLAYGPDESFMLLDLTQAAFDLSDRGVDGRPAPGPLDAFLWSDRGIYRPGETVHLGAMLRDERVRAVTDLPLTLDVRRPNGSLFRRLVLADRQAGGATIALDLADTAPLGGWMVEARVDPDGDVLGRIGFHVEEFVPERLRVDLATRATAIEPDAAVDVTATAAFLYGPPASGLDGAAEMTIEPDPSPFPQHRDYRFGLVQESFPARLQDLAFPSTDADGRSTIPVLLSGRPDTTLPLKATLRVEVSEPGGRPTRKSLTLPVRAHDLLIGVAPRFRGGRIAEGGDAAFDLIAVDGDGTRIMAPELSWELFEERVSWQLVAEEGRARYRAVTRDERLRTGTVAIAADAPAQLALGGLPWGRYRIEVFGGTGGAATSLRFASGWAVAPDDADRPDRAGVFVERESYAPGDTASVRIEPPFAGELLLTVATDRVHLVRQQPISAEGAVIEVPVTEAWGPGAYVTATVFRPLVVDDPRAPVRAVGLAWVGVEPGGRRLEIAMDAPAQARPRRPMTVPIAVKGDGGPVYLTLAAVDEGILQLTTFATPAPDRHYFGKRRLGLDMRDDYGRLIEWTGAPVGDIRQGGDEAGLGRALPAVPTRTVALFSGPVELDADGSGTITLDLPDFNGRLRLMAVAWSALGVGGAAGETIVRDPVVAEASLPRFLAPGDESRLTLSLHNVEGEPGPYSVAIRTEGPLAVDAALPITADLARDERRTFELALNGTGAGIGRIVLQATGPGGLDVTRDWRITVRPARPAETRLETSQLHPGETFRADGAVLASYIPGTGGLSFTYGNGPRIDVAGLSRALDRWAYGCLEQTVSRAFPMLVSADFEIAVDIDRSIARILDMQRYDGAFGLWGARGAEDPWATAYAMEFLTRARTAGYSVPQTGWRDGLEWLRGQTEQGAGPADALAVRAYALYVLSLAEAVRMPALRYYHDALLDRLPTPLAKGQLGAALARGGDMDRARAAFRSALDRPARDDWSVDFGSTVRDAAALAVLMREAGVLPERLPELIDRLPVGANVAAETSTQEQAWMLRAAQSQAGSQAGITLAVDGAVRTLPDPALIVPAVAGPQDRIELRNAGTTTLWQGATFTGVPATAPPASRHGMRITRRFLGLDGNPTNLDAVRRNDKFVVLIEAEAQTGVSHQALVTHGLPAGWEIETIRLSGDAFTGFDWLGDISEARAMEARDDRFVAAVDLTADSPKARFAFMVRAVTPGRYELPGGEIVDMYKPRFFARQAAGRVTVLP